MKRRYLVVYDYGQGGVWGYVLAPSSDEIVARFPELEVADDEPEWLTDELKKQLEERIEDIDHPGEGVLGNIVVERNSKT